MEITLSLNPHFGIKVNQCKVIGKQKWNKNKENRMSKDENFVTRYIFLQIEYVACPHATLYLCINQAVRTHD